MFFALALRVEREIRKKFSTFEKRNRNQTKCSQLSRREREKYVLCSSFESRKRNLKYLSPISRGEREYWKTNTLIPRVEWEKGNTLLLRLDHVLVSRFSSSSKMWEKISFLFSEMIFETTSKSAFGNLIEDNDSNFADVTGPWGCSSGGSPQSYLGWLQSPNNHPHPLF